MLRSHPFNTHLVHSDQLTSSSTAWDDCTWILRYLNANPLRKNPSPKCNIYCTPHKYFPPGSLHFYTTVLWFVCNLPISISAPWKQAVMVCKWNGLLFPAAWLVQTWGQEARLAEAGYWSHALEGYASFPVSCLSLPPGHHNMNISVLLHPPWHAGLTSETTSNTNRFSFLSRMLGFHSQGRQSRLL